MAELTSNRAYKDSVFTSLFNNKERLIELYNAIEDKNVSKDTEIEINTLEGTLLSSQKNDISFKINGKNLLLIEHQSTINENMPLRMLMYAGRLYEKITPEKDILRKKQVKIPSPEFYVLYNGKEKYPKEKILKLSEAFEGENVRLELEVKVINIRYDEDNEIIRKSESLKEYSLFMYKIEEYMNEGNNRDEAITKAIKYCVDNGVLKDFLESNSKEVKNMILTQYSLDEHLKAVYSDGLEEGEEKGRRQGIEEGKREGIEEGEEKAKREVAKSLLEGEMDVEYIQKITKLPIKVIQELKKQV